MIFSRITLLRGTSPKVGEVPRRGEGYEHHISTHPRTPKGGGGINTGETPRREYELENRGKPPKSCPSVCSAAAPHPPPLPQGGVFPRPTARQGRKPGVAWWEEGGREGVAGELLLTSY